LLRRRSKRTDVAEAGFKKALRSIDTTHFRANATLDSRKELVMHVVAADLIAADIATELDLNFAEANQYLDSLLAGSEEDWSSDLDD
jgi:hypothetical protein